MKLPRRKFLYLVAGAATVPALPTVAKAQATYPSRPVRLIVPFAAGGASDVVARLTGQSLSRRLGQQFVIENRPGGGSNVGTEAVAHALPDGYTLLMVDTSPVINAWLYDTLDFNFVRDIAPIASINRVPLVMEVNPSFPAKTIPDFIAYAKANPGKINMASAGNGTPSHLAGELFKMMTGVAMTHVPYRGAAPATTDLLGGQVQVFFTGVANVIEYVKAGRLRPLAVTSASRLDVLPDIPTVGEFVSGYEASNWYGIGAPRGTPIEIIDKLNTQINAALSDPKLKAQLADLGTTVLAGSPSGFGRLIAEESEKWAKVVKFSGAKPD
jgi:tripartite-type tricarboxylate transporter receptor subunit TctC